LDIVYIRKQWHRSIPSIPSIPHAPREIIEEFFYDDGLPFMVEKINLKYLGTLDHPLAKMLIDNTRNGIETVLEITPKFFSTWDFGKT
jgi:hypothetical protein